MRGMRKTSGEFRTSNAYQVRNDVQNINNMCMTYTTADTRKVKKVRKASRVSAKEIISIMMMILGLAAILFSFAEAYCMTYYKSYSQYIFLNMDENFVVLVSGFVSFICGIRLAWNS